MRKILRRIWLFSANKIKRSESVSKQPTQLIIELNSSLQQKLGTNYFYPFLTGDNIIFKSFDHQQFVFNIFLLQANIADQKMGRNRCYLKSLTKSKAKLIVGFCPKYEKPCTIALPLKNSLPSAQSQNNFFFPSLNCNELY